MKWLRRVDSDVVMPYILTISFMLILLSVFLAGMIVLFAQDLLFYSEDNLTFIRPSEAYRTFAGGLVGIALILLSFLATKMRAEKKDRPYKLAGLHVLLLVAMAPAFAFGVHHYAYLNPEGVHSSPLWTFSTESIEWEDVDRISRVIEEDSYKVLSYTFYSGDESVTIPYDTSDTRTARAVGIVRGMYDWPMEEHIQE